MKKFNCTMKDFDETLIANGFEKHFYDNGSSYMVTKVCPNHYMVVDEDVTCWSIVSDEDITDDYFLKMYAQPDAWEMFHIDEIPIMWAFGIRFK